MNIRAWLRVLERWDSPQEAGQVICYDDFSHYPAGTKDELINLSLIQETEPATTVECFECGQGCFIEPVWYDLPGGRLAYHACKGNDPLRLFQLGSEQIAVKATTSISVVIHGDIKSPVVVRSQDGGGH